MSGQGKGKGRPVEITLPDQASDQARASIPEHAVSRVAEALRAERGDVPDGEDDEEYIADTIMAELRERVAQYEYSEAVRAAHRAVPRPDVDW